MCSLKKLNKISLAQVNNKLLNKIIAVKLLTVLALYELYDKGD